MRLRPTRPAHDLARRSPAAPQPRLPPGGDRWLPPRRAAPGRAGAAADRPPPRPPRALPPPSARRTGA
ncbi:hypothetical protein CEK69_09890, partial [Xanthomonas sp. LMG 12462]